MALDAVVPVAGLGTRLRPLTDALPKELLPVGDRPVLTWVLEELAACGVDRAVLVTHPRKAAIDRYVAAAGAPLQVEAVLQDEPLGLGHAVLQARGQVSGPFAVALGDAVLGGRPPARIVARLLDAVRATGAAGAVAVQEVPAEDVGRYGVVAPAGEERDGVLPLAGIVEKPDPAAAPSRLAVAARYVLDDRAFDALERTPPGRGGEVQLTDALATLIDEGAGLVAVRLAPDEPRFDVGTPASWLRAHLELALTDPVHGAALRARAAELLDAHGAG